MDSDQLDEEQLYYKQKYLKYKLKYVALKKQIGGFVSIDIDVNALGKLVNDTGALLTGAPNAQPQAQTKQRNKTMKEIDDENLTQTMKWEKEAREHKLQNDNIINFLVGLIKNEKEMQKFLLIKNKLLLVNSNSSINYNAFNKLINPKLKLYSDVTALTSQLKEIINKGLENFYIKDNKGLLNYLEKEVKDFIKKGGHLEKRK
jgi:hypothetical protein